MKFGAGEKTLILIAAFVVAIAGLRFAQTLILPVFLAVAIAALTQPVVAWLERRRIPHWVAILLAVFLDLAVIAGIASVVGTSAQAFSTRLPEYQVKMGAIARSAIEALSARGLHLSPEQIARLLEFDRLVEVGTSTARSIASVVSDSILVLLLVVFMLIEVSRWREKIASALGGPRAEINRVEAAMGELQKYLVLKSLMCLITAVMSGIWFALWGVDYVLLWAMIVFLLNYIPTIGSVIAAIPPILVALVQGGPGTALGVAIGYIVINAGIGSAVEPRVMGRALGLSPLVVLLSLVFWGWLWGPVGALLSAPLTMAIKVAVGNTRDLRWVALLLGSAAWVARMNQIWANEPHTDLDPDAPPPHPRGREDDRGASP